MFVYQVLFLSIFYKLVSTAALPVDRCNASFTNSINSVQNSWRAGHRSALNPIAYGAVLDLEGLAHIRLNRSELAFRPLLALPGSFDARSKWQHCESLREVRNQGDCGSCWAVSSASAMTDRQCIHSNGKENFHFSAEDLVCMSGTECNGHQIELAWMRWQSQGVVSSACMPYSSNHFKGLAGCNNQVVGCMPYGQWSKNVLGYKNDKRYAKVVYSLIGEDELMTEMYINGPIVVAFGVYEDFSCYKHGIYHYTKGNYVNGHAVKLIGWGVQNGEKYWIAANSWGASWGEQGFFRIRRGVYECGIENIAVAGIPMLKGI